MNPEQWKTIFAMVVIVAALLGGLHLRQSLANRRQRRELQDVNRLNEQKKVA